MTQPADTTQNSSPGRRRRKTKAGSASSAAKAADDLVQKAPAQEIAAKRELKEIPELGTPFTGIRESVYTLPDPEGEYKKLEQALTVREALTPGALQSALNDAEDNARRAHRLYVVAKADYERFERECDPVVESLRDAANKELQAEKDAKQRSKAITDADVKGRASVLFPDEWKRINDRRIKAEGMLEHLRALAELWKQRCFSLSTMLNAGKRS